MQLSTTLTVSFLALQQFIAAAHRVDHKAAPSVPTNQRLRRAKTVKSDEETVQETAPATTQKGAETVSASDSGKPDKKGDKEDKKKSVESSSYYSYDGKAGKEDSGIELQDDEFTVGDPIDVHFELEPAKLVERGVTLNMTNSGDWKVGIFMKMENPQGGALEPIVSLVPSITEKDEDTLEGDVTFSDDAAIVALMAGREPSWPTDLIQFGTGYDIWLLDEVGAGILGPEDFVLELTEEMKEEAKLIEEEKEKEPKHGLMLYDKGGKKKGDYSSYSDGNSSKAGKAEEAAPLLVLGTDVQSLSEYTLVTDKTEYLDNEDIVVSFDISETSQVVRRLQSSDLQYRKQFKQRRLLPKADKEDEDKGKKGKKDDETTTSTTVAAGGTEGSTTIPSEESSTTLPTDVTTTTNEDAQGEDELEEGPPDMIDPELEEVIDRDDLSLYKIGIFMRMARPQGGKLEPLVSVPLCGQVDCSTFTVDQLKAGSVTFGASHLSSMTGEWPLNTGEHGTGFDIWVLNGRGEEVAGPTEFAIPELEVEGGDEEVIA